MNAKMTRKKIITAVTILLAATAVIHILSMLTLDRKLEYREEIFQSPNIPSELHGYRIAFITDTHNTDEKALKNIIAELNEKNIDLLLLGGDYNLTGDELCRTIEILASINTTDGIYGVEGNHDDYTELFPAMESNGISPLSNSSEYIRDGFYIAGTEDLWNRKPDIGEAVSGASSDDFVILLAHNADITMQQDTAVTDLVLSGHTHGGQATLFGLWSPGLTFRDTISDYGQRFMSGWCETDDGTPVYVSNGVGQAPESRRVFARPQVIILTL